MGTSAYSRYRTGNPSELLNTRWFFKRTTDTKEDLTNLKNTATVISVNNYGPIIQLVSSNPNSRQHQYRWDQFFEYMQPVN